MLNLNDYLKLDSRCMKTYAVRLGLEDERGIIAGHQFIIERDDGYYSVYQFLHDIHVLNAALPA